MRKRVFVLFMVLVVLAVGVMPAGAVTDGTVDGDGHPMVLLLLMEVGGTGERFRCSGTLLSPTVFVTAGHCTNNFPDSPYTAMRVFTESDLQAAIEAGTTNYPFAGPDSVEAVSWAAHPQYETGPFFLHDVGVVILQAPGIALSQYGELPDLDELDSLKPSRQTVFTAVGYGLQRSFPTAAAWKNVGRRTRMYAEPHLLQINTGFTGDFSVLLSNNANTGGTCFGDSGGPNFIGDSNTIGGVTSFGLNRPCGGTGGVFRVDREDVLDFVNSYLP
jgi:hypothetical protein